MKIKKKWYFNASTEPTELITLIYFQGEKPCAVAQFSDRKVNKNGQVDVKELIAEQCQLTIA